MEDADVPTTFVGGGSVGYSEAITPEIVAFTLLYLVGIGGFGVPATGAGRTVGALPARA